MHGLADRDQIEKFHRYNDLAREEGANVLVDRADPDADEIQTNIRTVIGSAPSFTRGSTNRIYAA